MIDADQCDRLIQINVIEVRWRNPVIPGMFFVQKALADLAVGCWKVLALGVTRVLNAGQKNRKWFMILYTLW